MAEAYKFELVSPERLLVSVDATSVVIPGSEGEMTVMAQHAPTMTTVRPGIVTVNAAAGGSERYVVFGGFADILPEGCTVLAESATHIDELNAADVAERVAAARAALAEVHEDEDKQRAEEFLSQLTTLQGTIIPA